MRRTVLFLFLGLALSGCSKSASSRTFSPVHTSLEVYFASNIGEGQGAIQPQLKNLKFLVPCWEGTVKHGDRSYSATIEYKGTAGGKDFYWVTLTAPPGAVGVPAPTEIAYEGRQIELWSDSKERIGMRPYVPSGERGGATNANRPVPAEETVSQ